MLCSITGQPVVNAVVSPKSGRIFEKSVIEAYVTERGTDPLTGETLHVADLIALDTTPTVARKPTEAPIPAILSSLQREFDSISLENWQLRQSSDMQIKKIAVYKARCDAAMRVISRLATERDEARKALEILGQDVSPTDDADLQNLKAHAEAASTSSEFSADAAAESSVPPKAVLFEADDIVNARTRLRNEHREMNRKFKGAIVEPSSLEIQGDIIAVESHKAVVFSHVEPGFRIVDLKSMEEEEREGKFLAWLHGEAAYQEGEFLVVNDKRVELEPVDLQSHPCGSIAMLDSRIVALNTSFDVLGELSVPGIKCFCVHPDGELLFLGYDDRIVFYSLIEGTLLQFPSGANAISASRNGYLVAWISDNSLFLHDMRHDDLPREYEVAQAQALEFGGDNGSLLAVLANEVLLWRWHHGDLIRVSHNLPNAVNDFAWDCACFVYTPPRPTERKPKRQAVASASKRRTKRRRW